MLPSMYDNGTYLDENPTWHVEDSPWKASQIIKMLNRNGLQPQTICEAGCGAGEILRQLWLQLPPDVALYGYEISPQAFRLCEQKANERLHFSFADIFAQESEGSEKSEAACFDIVMAIDVMEHVEDHFGFLRKLKTKGRYKILHIPLDLSVQTVFRHTPILDARTELGHLHYFTKATALATLEETGYTIIDSFYTDGPAEPSAFGWGADLFRASRQLFFSLDQDLAATVFGRYSLLVLAE